jgi:hypothetical protein
VRGRKMRTVISLMVVGILLSHAIVCFAQPQSQTPVPPDHQEQIKSAPRQIQGHDQKTISAGLPSPLPKADSPPQNMKVAGQTRYGDWLRNNALALTALIIAIFGGLPGLLKIIEYFRPISLKGSIKFYAPTSGDNPPSDGILVAVTLVNQGSKELVWRKVTGKLTLGGNQISLQPSLITKSQAFNNVRPWEKDLLKQQVLTPGIPINGYLHFLAPKGSIGTGFVSPSKLYLLFESESGRLAGITLPFIGNHPLGEGESFPTHEVSF